MSKTLKQIAQNLQKNTNKTQLIYAFNGTGKTRLSREFTNLIDSTPDSEFFNRKVLYYNDFTEELFYWDNKDGYTLKIKNTKLTNWMLNTQGLDKQVINNFNNYTKTPFEIEIDTNNLHVKFFIRNNNEEKEYIKISKGEESRFIWIFFYTLLDAIFDEIKYNKNSENFKLEYIFIDDPITSLDENNLIHTGIQLVNLITKNPAQLKFIITTHSPLFYNSLYREIPGKKNTYMLINLGNEFFKLKEKKEQNTNFSYHLHIKHILETTTNENIEKYHFMLLRNLYEKTCSFLGYKKWQNLLPQEIDSQGKSLVDSYAKVINNKCHNTVSAEEIAEPTKQDKDTLKYLLTDLTTRYYPKEDIKEDIKNV